MPLHPAPVPREPLAFSPDYSITQWLDVSDPRSGPAEIAIATGTFRNVTVTYLVNNADGRVRAEPAPANVRAAGARLKGLNRVLFLLFSLVGLDMQSGAMRSLWRLSAADSDRFTGLGFAGVRAARSAAMRSRFDTCPAQDAEPASSIDPCVGGVPASQPQPQPPLQASEPSPPAINPAATEGSMTLDAIPAPSLQGVMALLRGKGTAMTAVNRRMHAALAEEKHWAELKSRAKSVVTPADVLGILEAMNLASNGEAIPVLKGKRTREASVLAQLASSTGRRHWAEQHPHIVEQVRLAIMALPIPARHAALRRWLEVHPAAGSGKRCPGRSWPSDLYDQLPANEKAILCTSLISSCCWGEHYDAVALGLIRRRWLSIAKEMDTAGLESFTQAVLETRRVDKDPVYWHWHGHRAAVKEILRDSAQLDPARRALVISGILCHASRILREASELEDAGIPRADMAREGSLWRELLDAVPPRHAYAVLSRLTWQPSAHDDRGCPWHGYRDIAAAEVKRLMARVTSEEPEALTAIQRQELLFKIDVLEGTNFEDSWFAVMDLCERPETPTADLKRLVDELAKALPKMKSDRAWRRMLALCQSPRLSPVKQARLLALMESTLPTETSAYFQCEERFDLAFRLAERGGPIEAIDAMLLSMPAGRFEQALDLILGRSREEVRAALQRLMRVSGSASVQAKAQAMFDRFAIEQRIEWVEKEYVRTACLTRLLDIGDAGNLQPALTARLFHAVADYCISYSEYPTDMATDLLGFVPRLRDMIDRNPVLHTDVSAWAKIFHMVGRSVRHKVASSEELAQTLDATTNLLRKHAPGLTLEVHGALRARREQLGW